LKLEAERSDWTDTERPLRLSCGRLMAKVVIVGGLTRDRRKEPKEVSKGVGSLRSLKSVKISRRRLKGRKGLAGR
jgi:hypothetical protein